MGDDEMWRIFERAELVDATQTVRPTVDLTFPGDLDFSLEQRAFVAGLVSRIVENLTYELSNKWTTHMIHLLVAGDLQNFEDSEPRSSA